MIVTQNESTSVRPTDLCWIILCGLATARRAVVPIRHTPHW